MSMIRTAACSVADSFDSSFVAVPDDYAAALRRSYPLESHGVLALKLSWRDAFGGASRSFCVSWSDAVSSDGSLRFLSKHLASAAGISEGTIVRVSPVSYVSVASKVVVDPLTFEDWDSISKLANFVEQNALRNIVVVAAGQEIGLRVPSSSGVCRLVVRELYDSRGVETRLGKLSNTTEIVVRPVAEPEPEGDAEDTREVELKLRVVVRAGVFINPTHKMCDTSDSIVHRLRYNDEIYAFTYSESVDESSIGMDLAELADIHHTRDVTILPPIRKLPLPSCAISAPRDDADVAPRWVVSGRTPCSSGVYLSTGWIDPAVTNFVLTPMSSETVAQTTTPPLLFGVDAQLDTLATALRHALDEPSPIKQHICVDGPKGCGKSALVACAISRLEDVHVVNVECDVYVGCPRAEIFKSVVELPFEVAAETAPCVVVFDNLASLAPPHNKDSSTTWLVESLQDKIANAVDARVACVCITAPRDDLRSTGLFSADVKVSPPNIDARERLIAHFFDDADSHEVASQTEGFLPLDFKTLHKRASVLMRTRTDAGLTTDLVLQSLEGFTPVSLKDASLEAKEEGLDFSAVGGLFEAKTTLRNVLELPTLFAPLYARAPLRLQTGILLYGPPGCGKTLIAKAACAECDLSLITVKGPELLSKYVGASEENVRDLFARASAASPCAILFDEFESIAPRRGSDSTGVTDRVVNQLLTFLDGVEKPEGQIYVLAATSRPDLVDAALLRPGRLDKAILCDFPTAEEAIDILQTLMRRAGNFSAECVAGACELDLSGFTGADIRAVCNTAVLESADGVVSLEALTAAAADTRASVSDAERARFGRIHSRFLGTTEPQDVGTRVDVR